MTQIDELVKRARDRFALMQLSRDELADALEAQAARVKELELSNAFNEAQLNRANAHITALDAAAADDDARWNQYVEMIAQALINKAAAMARSGEHIPDELLGAPDTIRSLKRS